MSCKGVFNPEKINKDKKIDYYYSLDEDDDNVFVTLVDERGNLICKILEFDKETGKICRLPGIPKNLGLKIDSFGQLFSYCCGK